jgi:hypothetical protein
VRATWLALTNNNATDYQSGDPLHLDGAVGLHLREAFEIGAAGNVVRERDVDAHNTFEGDVVSAQATVAL